VGVFFVLPQFAHAANSFDSISFKPTTDHGYYLTVEQSETLGKWGYAFGLTTEFSNDSVVAFTQNKTRIRDVINEQVAMHVGGAIGLLDWLNAGLLVGFVPYHNFNAPTTGAAANGARMGDIRLNLKARILDNKKYPVGLAIVPFVTFPTGSDSHFVGNGTVTGGANVVVESPRFRDKFSAALNLGVQGRKTATLSTGSSIGTQFLLGAAVNYAVLEYLHLIAEVNGWTPFGKFWKDNVRNLEGNGAVRWLPRSVKGMQVTVGGGTGILDGIGAPDYRVFGMVAYRRPSEEKPPVREEIIRTNKVHFEFDKSRIKPKSYPVLDHIAHLILSRNDIEHVRVEGHTDYMGSDAYNIGLSNRRANSVMKYLIKKGVPKSMLSAEGKGERVPIADNATKRGRALNRRVEFHLRLKPDAKVKLYKDEAAAPTYLEK
jgi:outer membrane protein OmpA-like peptidoglycan-associated protein